MLTIHSAAARIARELPELETVVDKAISGSAALMHSMATARTLDDVPAGTGQAALLRLQRAQANLIAAASEVRKVHRDLKDVNREIRAMSDENGDCPWPASAQLADTGTD